MAGVYAHATIWVKEVPFRMLLEDLQTEEVKR
jgi:hypothetical protein